MTVVCIQSPLSCMPRPRLRCRSMSTLATSLVTEKPFDVQTSTGRTEGRFEVVDGRQSLDRFGELEHLMQLIKARAHLYAEQTT